MKDIMLKITGKQINRNNEVEEETVEFMTEGKLYKKNGSTYIVYEETEMSGLEGVKTTLRIDDASGDVKMKRFGKGINSLYETPFGAVPMEVLTYKIVNDLEPDEGKGKLFIDYEISLKGLAESRSMLDIEVTPTMN